MVREEISLVLNHALCGNLLQQPQKSNTPRNLPRVRSLLTKPELETTPSLFQSLGPVGAGFSIHKVKEKEKVESPLKEKR